MIATQAKERPILFSTLMVKAILEGRKTMTRRVVKYPVRCKTHYIQLAESKEFPPPSEFCPYGDIGDILWVRETWQYIDFCGEDNGYVYKASENGQAWQENTEGWSWRPSIFMPREACRIRLEITDIKVERLQEISEEDAQAEGVDKAHLADLGQTWSTYGEGFRLLWERINGTESWNINPWVWCITFKPLAK